MAKAKEKSTTQDNPATATDVIRDMEAPLRKCSALAYAVRAFANSGELSKEANLALDALATCLLDELAGVTEDWETIFHATYKGVAAHAAP